jgi:hypothetical protein
VGFELRTSLPLQPQLQSSLLWLFWRWGFVNYLPRQSQTTIFPISDSQVARIGDESHWLPAMSIDLNEKKIKGGKSDMVVREAGRFNIQKSNERSVSYIRE